MPRATLALSHALVGLVAALAFGLSDGCTQQRPAGPDDGGASDADRDAGSEEVEADAASDAQADADSAPFNADDNPFPCLRPESSLATGLGLLVCRSGMVYRPTPRDCPLPEPNPKFVFDPEKHACQRDADCGEEQPFCFEGECLDPCVTDSDCGENVCICEPDTGIGTCDFADDCHSDLDCQSGFHCAYSRLGYGDSYTYRFRCQTRDDGCGASPQCYDLPEAEAGKRYICQLSPELGGPRQCEELK